MRALLLVAGLAASMPAAPAVADDFYDVRLRVGAEAYRERRFREAEDNLRIAAFGFLERPERLTEALARLALAQAAGSRPGPSDATIARFLVVERQFGAYEKVQLEQPARGEFEELLLRRVTPANLSSFPGLARIRARTATPRP
jgi:hypothetical protein